VGVEDTNLAAARAQAAANLAAMAKAAGTWLS
jgi:hypothetical protein